MSGIWRFNMFIRNERILELRGRWLLAEAQQGNRQAVRGGVAGEPEPAG